MKLVCRSSIVLCAAAVVAGSLLAPPLSPLEAQPSRVLRGRVVDREGAAVVGAQVTTERLMLRTDDEGRFTLRLEGCESTRVAVRRVGFRPASVTVQPCDGAVPDTLRVVLERAPVVLASDSVIAELSGIEGVVETAAGDPVAGAEVTVFHLGRAERGRTVIADYDGRFTLLDLEPGAAMLRVRHPRMHVVTRGVPLRRATVGSIGISMTPLEADRQPGGDDAGYGVDEARYLDMARRIQARPSASVLLTSAELMATGEANLGCAIGKVPGVIPRLLGGIPARSTRLRGSEPIRFSGGCWDGPLCIVEDGRRRVDGGPPYRTSDVAYVEVYANDFHTGTVNLRGCSPPMLVVWLRQRDGW